MRIFSAVSVIAVLAVSSSKGISADAFEQSVRPLLRDYCVTCHSTEKQEGELDLERFLSLEQVKRHADVWERVQEQLALGEMPPKDAKQLSAEPRRLLADWVRSTLKEIALASAISLRVLRTQSDSRRLGSAESCLASLGGISPRTSCS